MRGCSRVTLAHALLARSLFADFTVNLLCRLFHLFLSPGASTYRLGMCLLIYSLVLIKFHSPSIIRTKGRLSEFGRDGGGSRYARSRVIFLSFCPFLLLQPLPAAVVSQFSGFPFYDLLGFIDSLCPLCTGLLNAPSGKTFIFTDHI